LLSGFERVSCEVKVKGSWRLRLQEFIDNWHLKIVRLSAVRTGQL